MNYIAGEQIELGDVLILGEDGKTLYKAHTIKPPNQIFHSFFDEFVFGKFHDRILNDVIEANPKYVQWCINNGIIDINKKIEDRFNRKLETYLKLS